MLFCGRWRNVETSWHKHFIVVSRRQQTLPLTANLLTLNSSKTDFFLIGLTQKKFTTLLSVQPTLLATLALSLMNTLPSATKYLHFLNPATITFVNFAVSAHISTSKQPAPLPPPSSILNLITVTLSITTFQTINLTGSNRSRTLLLVLLLSSSSIGACRWRCCSCESPPSCSVLSSPMPWREAKIKLAQIFLHRS